MTLKNSIEYFLNNACINDYIQINAYTYNCEQTICTSIASTL